MIPLATIDELIADRIPQFSIIDRNAIADGNVTSFELDVISSLVRHKQPRTSFEIGTFDGRTTLHIAANGAPDGKVFTLDLPASEVNKTRFELELNEDNFVKKASSGDRFAKSEFRSKITQLYGDSATFDFSPYIGQVDFMFVDGSHAYQYVMQDTATALKLVKDGGTILWHDYVAAGFTPFPGVPDALKVFFLSDERFRGMKHILGTSIIYLQVPKPRTNVHFDKQLVGDSSKPQHLSGHLTVELSQRQVSVGQKFRARIFAKNTGKSSWLSSRAPLGPVRLGTKLLSPNGSVIDISYYRNDFPHWRSTFPGEIAVFEAEIPAPEKGDYILDFDLVADAVIWLNTERNPFVQIPVSVTD